MNTGETAGAYEITLGTAQWAERYHPLAGERRAGADDWYPTVRGLLDDRARPEADPDDDYFVVMAHPDDAAERIGPWDVRFVQVLGVARHGFIVEFGTTVADGSNGPNFRLFRREVPDAERARHVGEDHRDDGLCADQCHPLHVALCAFRCLVERRDLTRYFDLKIVWPYEIAEFPPERVAENPAGAA